MEQENIQNTSQDTDQDIGQDISFREKATGFLEKYGFFVVAGLCVTCLGIALAVTYRPNAEEAPPIAEETPVAEQAEVPVEPETRVEVTAPTAAPVEAIAPAVTSAPASESSAKAVSASKAPSPVEGNVIWGYAVDTLLYSKTLEQWTTHEGVDISAKQGSEVKNIRPGKVKSVSDDDALGVVVTIEHDSGLLSLYGNLGEKPPVSEGQSVKTGDTIGYVGNTAMSECAMDSHLHFAVYKGGVPEEPSKYILVNK